MDDYEDQKVQEWEREIAKIGELSLRQLEYELRKLGSITDLEERHRRADLLLLACLGCPPVTREFLKHNTWYA